MGKQHQCISYSGPFPTTYVCAVPVVCTSSVSCVNIPPSHTAVCWEEAATDILRAKGSHSCQNNASGYKCCVIAEPMTSLK